VLLNTPLASDLIRKGDVTGIKDLMRTSTEQGMQTFDQALYDLYLAGEITYQDAIAHADSANDLRLLIKLGADNDPEKMKSLAGGLSMQEDENDNRPSSGNNVRRR
jgi:twitching motility protein PilU